MFASRYNYVSQACSCSVDDGKRGKKSLKTGAGIRRGRRVVHEITVQREIRPIECVSDARIDLGCDGMPLLGEVSRDRETRLGRHNRVHASQQEQGGGLIKTSSGLQSAAAARSGAQNVRVMCSCRSTT